MRNNPTGSAARRSGLPMLRGTALVMLLASTFTSAAQAQTAPHEHAHAKARAVKPVTAVHKTVTQKAGQQAPLVAQPGQAAFDFTGATLSGGTRSLSSVRGKEPAVLFFFCGCDKCHQTAAAWATLQASATLRQAHAAQGTAPKAIVVYAGEAGEGRQFLKEAQLDGSGSGSGGSGGSSGTGAVTLFADADLRVAERYKSVDCPRAFVLDDKGIIRFVTPTPVVESAREVAAKAGASATASNGTTSADAQSSNYGGNYGSSYGTSYGMALAAQVMSQLTRLGSHDSSNRMPSTATR